MIVSNNGEGWHERHVTVWSRLGYGPIMALPWAVVGGVMGSVIGVMGGRLEIASVFIGVTSGIFHSLLFNPFDGWLTITMPIDAFIGASIGLVAGFLIRLVHFLVKG